MCGFTGYRGRVGVYELLVVSDAIRQHIVEKSTHTEMRKTAIREGMKTMQVQAFQMVADGITTIDEVVRSVYAPGVDLDGAPLAELMPAKRALDSGPAGIEPGPDGIGAGSDDDAIPTVAPSADHLLRDLASTDDPMAGLQSVEGSS